jgi:hypothetical protein
MREMQHDFGSDALAEGQIERRGCEIADARRSIVHRLARRAPSSLIQGAEICRGMAGETEE